MGAWEWGPGQVVEVTVVHRWWGVRKAEVWCSPGHPGSVGPNGVAPGMWQKTVLRCPSLMGNSSLAHPGACLSQAQDGAGRRPYCLDVIILVSAEELMLWTVVLEKTLVTEWLNWTELILSGVRAEMNQQWTSAHSWWSRLSFFLFIVKQPHHLFISLIWSLSMNLQVRASHMPVFHLEVQFYKGSVIVILEQVFRLLKCP